MTVIVWIKKILKNLLSALLALLPTSPFREFILKLDKLPALGYINWFIPISEIMAVGAAWLVAIGIYYLYSVVARWVKLIE